MAQLLVRNLDDAVKQLLQRRAAAAWRRRRVRYCAGCLSGRGRGEGSKARHTNSAQVCSLGLVEDLPELHGLAAPADLGSALFCSTRMCYPRSCATRRTLQPSLDRQSADDIWTTSVTVFEVRFRLARMAKGRKRIVLQTAFALAGGPGWPLAVHTSVVVPLGILWARTSAATTDAPSAKNPRTPVRAPALL